MANGIFLLFVLVALVNGLSLGPQRQFWSLAALAASTYLTGNAYTAFVPLIRPFIESESGTRLASFLIVFFVLGAVLNVVIDALVDHRLHRRNELTAGGRLAGGLLGVLYAVSVTQVLASVILIYPVLRWERWILEADMFVKIFKEWPYMLPLLPDSFSQVLEMLP